jgi:hypothetical protein
VLIATQHKNKVKKVEGRIVRCFAERIAQIRKRHFFEIGALDGDRLGKFLSKTEITGVQPGGIILRHAVNGATADHG